VKIPLPFLSHVVTLTCIKLNTMTVSIIGICICASEVFYLIVPMTTK